MGPSTGCEVTQMVARRDYSLNGAETKRAWERGLVSAEWYKCDVPRKQMKEFMQRSDFPALWHVLLWFALIAAFAAATILTWGSWWFILPFFFYCSILTGSSDPRWHECGHGTAFKTQWLNTVVYHFACYWLLREPQVWRYSHTRHHTDTIIVGRDPEIITPRPPDLPRLLLTVFNLTGGLKTIPKVFQHAMGKKTFPEEDFVPESEWPKVFLSARVWVACWAATIVLALATWSILPLLMLFVPQFLGHWVVMFFGVTQHIGLADDVLDHRLNTRTIYMNPVFRFLYLNMNYHVEHHMFPMVPYHALPKLHEAIKADTPEPYPSTWAAYKEIFPAVFRQLRDPEWWVHRKLPGQPAADDGGKADAPAQGTGAQTA